MAGPGRGPSWPSWKGREMGGCCVRTTNVVQGCLEHGTCAYAERVFSQAYAGISILHLVDGLPIVRGTPLVPREAAGRQRPGRLIPSILIRLKGPGNSHGGVAGEGQGQATGVCPWRGSREGASRDGTLTVTASQGKGLQPQLRLAVLGGRSLEGCRRVWGLRARRAPVTRRSGAPQTPCTMWQLTHRHHGTHRLARYNTLSARCTGACTVLESAGRQRREQGEGEGAAKDTVSLRVDRTQAHTLTRAPATHAPHTGIHALALVCTIGRGKGRGARRLGTQSNTNYVAHLRGPLVACGSPLQVEARPRSSHDPLLDAHS
jgi:hypothetical protein